MKRAEWFVTKGKGHWATARVEAKCERRTVMGPCGNPIHPGDVYLLTDLPVYPDSTPEDKRRWIMKKYCFKCADAELPV
jgi:hypothetical protein